MSGAATGRSHQFDRQLVVRVDSATLDALAADSEANERTVAQTVRLAVRRHLAKPTEWWICSDFRRQGGKKMLGPFQTRDLALTVREMYEVRHKPRTYAVDEWPAQNDGKLKEEA